MVSRVRIPLSLLDREICHQQIWNLSSAGRASALQAEGHRFEPYCSHHYGLVVQLVRTLACHARGRRFDPDPGRQFASVAQSVEQGTENPRVIGSIPIGGTLYAAVAHLVERHLAKVEVASSSLVGRSIKEQQQLLRYGPVAQLVRAPACHAGGRRFEPDPGRHLLL